MLIGVPKEIKNHEYRVGLTPAGVKELIKAGHQVLVQKYAGVEVGYTGSHYIAVGAQIVETAEELFATADLIIKVKEPQSNEIDMLRAGQILFTYLHLAPDLAQTEALIKSNCVAIAYETVTDARGGLPLLAPMSEVAGRMAIQAGAHCLEKAQGGAGILLSGVPGVAPANVVVLGGGVVGLNAARMALGLGARVAIFDVSLSRLKEIDTQFGPNLTTIYASSDAVEHALITADLVIGAVLVPGGKAPKLVSRNMLKLMKPGAVLVDVAIDQGGCFETSQPTTHEAPTYVVENIIHYCVANMPGGVARTATQALTNATLPFVLDIANKGWQQAMSDDPHLRNGLNVCHGKITHAAVARDLELDYTPSELLI